MTTETITAGQWIVRATQGRQPVEQLVAQGQSGPSDGEHDDDDQERDRTGDRRGRELAEQETTAVREGLEQPAMVDVVAQEGLHDTDREGAGEGHPEPAEPTDEGGGESSQHRVAQRVDKLALPRLNAPSSTFITTNGGINQ